MDVVRGLVQERPIVIFSKTGCPVSHSMRQLITGFGANPTVYEIDQMQMGEKLREFCKCWVVDQVYHPSSLVETS
ncbi:Monothiol glutaredoxin-S6 [Bienertia sinuspersici]